LSSGVPNAVVAYFSLRMADERTWSFLNVDLDLRATYDLAELVAAFEPGASALECMPLEGGFFANLELDTDPATPEAAIHGFVALVKRLPPRARALWSEASQRAFSIAFEAGSSPSPFELALSPDVLRLAADVGAHVVFVVYPREYGTAPA
jgi:hypothetical protein